MPKILIVEDERLVRSDIVYKVTRSGLHFDWVMEAENGMEALEILERNRPDILVTDIMMDGMTGIELIRRATEILPELVSMIICGYPDFHFAQEAISLNVLAYLLKPVRLEQVRDSLQKAVLEVLRREDVSLLEVRSDLLEQKLADGQLKSELYAFLNGFQNTDTVSLYSLFPEDSRFFLTAVLHFEVAESGGGNGGFLAKDHDLLRYAARNIAQEMGRSYCLAFNHIASKQQLIAIFATSAGEEETAGKELQQRLLAVQSEIARHLKVRVFVGASCVFQSMSVKSLDEARHALDLRFCLRSPSQGSVWSYGNYLSETAPEPDLELYRKFLGSGDSTRIRSLVRQTFASFQDKPVLNLRIIFVEMVCILARYCSKQGVSIFSILGSEYINGSVLDRLATLEEISDNLSSVIGTALDQWVGSMESIADILRRVKSHINENFADPELCTNDLASRFCISPGYLSASYKKYYEITISKYIITLRMEHAMRLLQNMQLPIRIVAESCGFNNISYFMRVFKKYYGYTCTQCREEASAPGFRQT